MDIVLTIEEIIIRLVVSCIIGFLIGLNREKHSSAGVRTHMILAVGVCVITLVQVDMTAETIRWNMENSDYLGAVSSDIGRLTAQIVSGIGFLGSGLILVRNDRTVDGMTSAVSLWTVASISIAIGYGEYLVSLIGAGLLLIILTTMNSKKTKYGILQLNVNFKEQEFTHQELNEFLKKYGGKTANYSMEHIFDEDNSMEYRYIFEIEYRGFIDKIDFIESFIKKYDKLTFIELS